MTFEIENHTKDYKQIPGCYQKHIVFCICLFRFLLLTKNLHVFDDNRKKVQILKISKGKNDYMSFVEYKATKNI